MAKHSGNKQNSRQNEKIRLNKYLAECGIASRRKADELIQAGKVKVNKATITELGVQVGDDDLVEYCGKKVDRNTTVYLMMNKPKDYLTTTDDPHNRKKVMDLLKSRKLPLVYPVGRLDRNTSGLLIFTNDGELANKLMHPSRKIEKMYKVTLDKPLPRKEMEKMVQGVQVDEDFIVPDSIMYQDPAQKTKVLVSIHTGQYRIVRRMFKTLGYDVKNLDRIYFAGIKKERLKPGEWRHLSKKEVNMLKNKAGIK